MTISRGLTFIEVAFATLLLAVIVALVSATLVQGTDAASQQTSNDELKQRCAKALDQIALNLRNTELGHIGTEEYPLLSGNSLIAFTENLGYDDNGTPNDASDDPGIIWSSAETVYLVEGGELVLYKNNNANAVYSTADGDDRYSITPLVESFTAHAGTPAHQDPLTDDAITLTLTLRRQIGILPNGSPWEVTATASRTVFIRPDSAAP